MRNTKKTTNQDPDGFQLAGYTEAGVHLLNETENYMCRAVLVYHAENEYFLEAFKLFYEFIIELEPMEMHLTMARYYLKLLELAPEGKPVFANVAETKDFHLLLELISNLAAEQRLSIMDENRIMHKIIDQTYPQQVTN